MILSAQFAPVAELFLPQQLDQGSLWSHVVFLFLHRRAEFAEPIKC